MRCVAVAAARRRARGVRGRARADGERRWRRSRPARRRSARLDDADRRRRLHAGSRAPGRRHGAHARRLFEPRRSYRDEGEPAQLSLDDLSLFVIWEPLARLRFFSELEYADVFDVDDRGARREPARSRRRSSASTSTSASPTRVNLRGGIFLTPVGRWNVIHAAPLVWTTSRPLTHRDAVRPERDRGHAVRVALPVGGHADLQRLRSVRRPDRGQSATSIPPITASADGCSTTPTVAGRSARATSPRSATATGASSTGLDFLWSQRPLEVMGEAVIDAGDGRRAAVGLLRAAGAGGDRAPRAGRALRALRRRRTAAAGEHHDGGLRVPAAADRGVEDASTRSSIATPRSRPPDSGPRSRSCSEPMRVLACALVSALFWLGERSPAAAARTARARRDRASRRARRRSPPRRCKRIYLKRQRFWDDGHAIVAINQEVATPAREAFTRLVFGDEAARLPAYWNEQYFHGVLPPIILGVGRGGRALRGEPARRDRVRRRPPRRRVGRGRPALR